VIEHARTMLGLAAVMMYLHKINLKLESHNFKQVNLWSDTTCSMRLIENMQAVYVCTVAW
jgi:hypothetical protein